MIPGIEENFEFMVLETRKQLQDAARMLKAPHQNIIRKIKERDNYIDILNNVIQTKCFSSPVRTKEMVDYLKAMDTISRNIERLGDYAVSIVNQSLYLRDPEIINSFDYSVLFKELIAASNVISKAFVARDVELALKICKCENTIDHIHSQTLREILYRLPHTQETGDLVTCLFIFGYLERAGDAMQNIGEAILSMCLGERVRVNEYISLKELGHDSGIAFDQQLGDMSLRSMGETRSGCRINKIGLSQADEEPQDKRDVIFKDGSARKINLEKEKLEQWHELAPGLVPRVFGYQKGKQEASLLLEFLRGRNLKEMVLDLSDQQTETALAAVQKILSDVWTKTMTDDEVPLKTIKQIRERIEDVYTVHPDFRSPHYKIGALDVPSFEELLRSAGRIERKLAAPFSVWSHGDFNLDNILYDNEAGSVHFLDVYRSGMKDYVQDMAVFLISNFRLPIFDSRVRKRINQVILSMYDFTAEFARDHQDPVFEARLAFGLVRSFVTSTRFELNHQFAKTMMMRASFLLEKITEYDGDSWDGFRLPEAVLTY